MANWFTVHRESDGELVSQGTLVGDLRGTGLAKIDQGPTRPVDTLWNPSTLTFDPLPPQPPAVSRVDEFMDALPSSLRNRSEIRAEVALLLGPEFENRAFDQPRDLS